jgi:hypothetical protein
MSVEKWRKTGNLQPRQQFVSKSGRILARLGDEDLEFFPCAGHELPARPKRRDRPRGCRAAQQPDEPAPFELIEEHSDPASQGRIAGYQTDED